MIKPDSRVLAAIAPLAFLLAIAAPVRAADRNTAKGSLTIDSLGESRTIELSHAYAIVGPDPYEAGKRVRSIVFTPTDRQASIEACADNRCVRLLEGEFLRIDLDEPGLVAWAARIGSASLSGSVPGDALTLTTDTSDRLTGTLKLDTEVPKRRGTITFDAALVKTFGDPQ